MGIDCRWESRRKSAPSIWSPLGWGRLTGKNPPRSAAFRKVSRLHKTTEQGPQVPEEYLYKVVDALDEVGKEVGKNGATGRLELVAAKADRCQRNHGCAKTKSNFGKTSGQWDGT